MIFELVTGDYLFDPKKGKTYRKNDDHLALMSELIGPCPDRNFLETHSKCWKFYDKKKKTPKLKNIKKLQPWPLYRVLLEKYRLKDCESRSLTSFLSAMLKWKPKDRASARDLLDHPWLRESDDYSVWMSKPHLKEFKLVHIAEFPGFLNELKLKNIQEEGKAQGLTDEEIEAYVKAEEEKMKEEEQAKVVMEKANGIATNGEAGLVNGEAEGDDDEEIEGTESSDSESSAYESGRSDESDSEEEDSDEDQ
jgi:serine/threonine-protein kinase SRPK3